MSASASDEDRRLRALLELDVLDSAREPIFDTLVQLASDICGAPIALLSLVDADRQWFKANVGLDGVTQTPREVAFCDHAIRREGVMVVEDAIQDTRFEANPLVTGAPHIRFYAGAPLVVAGGERIGTLCVIDPQRRGLEPAQRAALERLAQAATQALEMRRDLIRRTYEARTAHDLGVAESEAKLRAILDVQKDLVSQATGDGRLLYVNPAYAAHFGRTPEQIVGTNLFDYVAEADRARVRERLSQVLRTGVSQSVENRMVAADGTVCWVSWTNSRQDDGHGGYLLHSTGRDITQQRQTELQLREQRALLARTEQLTRTGGWALDLRSGQLSWSDETRRLHEVDADFVPALDNAIGFYAPASRPVIEAAVQRGVETGQAWDLELQLVSAKGRQLWVRALGEVEMEDGQAVRLAGAFQDVTERHRLQQQLAQSERFVRRLADELPVRVAYLDRDRRFRFVNRMWSRLAGVPVDQAIGRTRAEIFPQQPDELFRRRAAKVLQGEPVRFEFDERVGGELRRFENRLIPDRDETGEVQGFFVAGVDVTDRDLARKSQGEIAAIFEATTDFVLQWGEDDRVIYANPSARAAFALGTEEQPAGIHALDVFTEDFRQRYVQDILPELIAKGSWLGPASIDLPGRLAVPVSLMLMLHRDVRGEPTRASAVIRDVSDQVAAQDELRRQTSTLQSVADAFPAMVAVMDAAGRYRFVNRAFARAWNRATMEIVGRGARELIGEQEFARRQPWIERALRGEHVHFEQVHDTPLGTLYDAIEYIPLCMPGGELDGFLVITQDRTEQRREEIRLQALSRSDPLTGLLNRAGFESWVAHTLGGRHDETVALLYVDLDRFKPINDTHGHGAGDQVLREVARRLTRLVRPSDAIARLGGDEFALALPGMASDDQLRRVGDKIVEALSRPFDLPDGIAVMIGASVGGVVGPARPETWPLMLERADQLLYEAKRSGRGHCRVEHVRVAP